LRIKFVEARPLKYIAEASGAETLSGAGELLVSDVCTDSRQAKAGDVFFAIEGEKFDGHNFLSEVAAKKVAAVVVQRRKVPASLPGCAVLAVENPRLSLGKLAAAYRREFSLPIVAVGGSNGKTTTKELLASVLRQRLFTLWSEASFNNDIGVPMTLLRLQRTHQAAVLEVGTNHPGELAPLVKMITPRFGVITNIGREHLEFFGDLGGVAQEEGCLAELLPTEGALFINGDDEWAGKIAARTRARVIRAGLGEKNDWRAVKVRLDKGGSTFQITAPGADFDGEYRLNLLGRHQVANAVLAIAVAAELGLKYADIVCGLADCPPPKMRMQFWEANGVRVLDDAYNANTDSMIAALETLCDLPLQGRRVAVLGDMGEQGAHSAAAHAEVGRHAARLGVGQLFAVGPMAAGTARAARDAGLKRVIEFADVESAVLAVRKFLKTGDVVLLKASRAARLERIAESLKTEKN
jgi:UDP-N-acetylmuramoyl-tripeptide--D-alanyl-D-alanine ligase